MKTLKFNETYYNDFNGTIIKPISFDNYRNCYIVRYIDIDENGNEIETGETGLLTKHDIKDYK